MLTYHASEMTKMKLEHANAHSELLNSHSTLVNSLNLKHQENTARLQMEHQTALNGFNDQLSAKEKYHLSLIETMQGNHATELQKKLQERIALEAKHQITVNYLVAQHKKDKDLTISSNLSDLRSYDQKMMDKHNDYAERMNMTTKERAEYDLKMNSQMSGLYADNGMRVMTLTQQAEANRKEREAEHNLLIGVHEGKQSDLQLLLNQHIQDLAHAKNTHQHLSSQLMASELLLSGKSGVESQHAEALLRESMNGSSRAKLQTEVDSCTDYILQLEEKVYRSHKTSLELLK